MTLRYPGIIGDDEAGPEGEFLELCSPILWPGREHVNEAYVEALMSRLVSASYRGPELLNLFALRKACLTRILVFARQCFEKEETLVDITVPHNGQVHVFGDTHGDIHSLIEGFTKTGLPNEDNIICFAGDCVDRGSWGVEVLVVIFALKLWKPDCVFLIRGNHETSGCTARYGFVQEVQRKYDDKMFKLFMKLFRELPCAAVISTLPSNLPESTPLNENEDDHSSHSPAAKKVRKRSKRRGKTISESDSSEMGKGWRSSLLPGERRVLVVHGGLFRSWKDNHKKSMVLGDLEDLANARRQVDDPLNCIVEDVVWSDPQILSNDISENALRGAGILYGQGAVESFFKKNNLHGILRAHEGPDMREKRPEMNNMLDGYSLDMELVNGFLATVFSTANYRLSYPFCLPPLAPDMPRGNNGAIATLFGKGIERMQLLPKFIQFEKRFYPKDCVLYYKPENTDKSAATPRNSFS